MKHKFKPEICEKCTQTKNYLILLDRGSALILLAMSHAVVRLGRNKVHLQHDMEANFGQFKNIQEMVEAGYMTSRMQGNASRPRYHGLIASLGDKSGEFCITHKGGMFLQGSSIPRCAVIDKIKGHNAGYWNEEEDTVTLSQLLKESTTWNIPKLFLPGQQIEQPALNF